LLRTWSLVQVILAKKRGFSGIKPLVFKRKCELESLSDRHTQVEDGEIQ